MCRVKSFFAITKNTFVYPLYSGTSVRRCLNCQSSRTISGMRMWDLATTPRQNVIGTTRTKPTCSSVDHVCGCFALPATAGGEVVPSAVACYQRENLVQLGVGIIHLFGCCGRHGRPFIFQDIIITNPVKNVKEKIVHFSLDLNLVFCYIHT